MSQTMKIFTACEAPGCVALHTQEFQMTVGDRLPELNLSRLVMLPDDWQQVGGQTFCMRHKIAVTIVVDGTPL